MLRQRAEDRIAAFRVGMGRHQPARLVAQEEPRARAAGQRLADRKSTRLNSSHPSISYAVFCLKKKKKIGEDAEAERRRVNLEKNGESNHHLPGVCAEYVLSIRRIRYPRLREVLLLSDGLVGRS